MRRFPAFLGVVGIASALVLVGVPAAQAVEPAPPPVLEIPDVPSKQAFMGPVPGSGNQASDMLRAMLGFKAKTPAVLRPPVPITAPTAFQRALGGSIMMLPQLAWGIGANGTLTAIAAVTGSDYSSVYCSQPEWYQGVTWAVNMTVAPDCSAALTVPNDGFVPRWAGTLTYGSFNVSIAGEVPLTRPASNGGRQLLRVMCLKFAGTLPTGYSYFAEGWNRSEGGITWSGSSPYPKNCDQLYGPGNVSMYLSAPATVGVVVVRRISDNSVVATMTPVQITDPVRTPKCRITWSDSTVTTGTGTPYKETTGLPLSAAGLGCESAFVSKPGAGPNFLPSRIQVESDDGGSITTISDQEVPPMTETQRLPMMTGNGRGLVLEKVVADVVKSCMTWEADCANWWEQTDEGTTPGTYKCSFGGTQIALTECGPYRRTFDTKTDKPTITDPVTGNDVEWAAGPDVNSTNPGTGPTPGEACMSQWGSAPNPLEWVLQPVKCALVWAFVPRQARVDQLRTDADAAWRASAPGKLAGAVGAVSPALAALHDGDCGGLILPTPKVGAGWSVVIENRAFLAACPGDFFAPWAPTFYWFTTATIAITGFFAVKRFLDRFVGF